MSSVPSCARARMRFVSILLFCFARVGEHANVHVEPSKLRQTR